MRKLFINIPRTQVHCKQGTRVNITFKDCLGNKFIIKQKRIHRRATRDAYTGHMFIPALEAAFRKQY